MIDVSIILPCYQSAGIIEKRVHDIDSVMEKTRWTWEILLCDDASRDRTAELCQTLVEADPSRRRFFPSPVNRGRGRNVTEGVHQSQGRIIGFMDADQSTAAHYLLPVLQAIESGADVAEARRFYKIHLKELPFIGHRLLAHVVYARLVQWVLGMRHDTETGFKFFNRPVILDLIQECRHPGWFWDTEIIANAHAKNYAVAEIPSLFVRTPGMGSTVRLLKDSWVQFSSLVRYARGRGWRRLRQRCCGG
jgi:dolichyl-phosphate beta-glucosyltransferase